MSDNDIKNIEGGIRDYILDIVSRTNMELAERLDVWEELINSHPFNQIRFCVTDTETGKTVCDVVDGYDFHYNRNKCNETINHALRQLGFNI